MIASTSTVLAHPNVHIAASRQASPEPLPDRFLSRKPERAPPPIQGELFSGTVRQSQKIVTIQANHPEFREPLAFASMKDVVAWAEAEWSFWAWFTSLQTQASQTYVAAAQTQLQRVIDLAHAENASDSSVGSGLTNALSYLTLLSSGPKGQVLSSMKQLGYDARMVGIALAAFLNREELRNLSYNNNFTFDLIAGFSAVVGLEAAGDPQRLLSFLTEISTRKVEWARQVEALKEQTIRSQDSNDAAVKKLQESVDEGNRKVAEVTAKFESEIAEVRNKFEHDFALRTPMTYWSEKAGRHRQDSTRYRRWFTGILIGGIATLSIVAWLLLFPFMKGHPTAYWALILFSVAIAVWAWPLRMTSKQYLVHQHLFEDAMEREVIARTFLALNEQTKLTDADRHLLLGALVRHAAISLVGDDAGLNLTDMLTAKTLMQP